MVLQTTTCEVWPSHQKHSEFPPKIRSFGSLLRYVAVAMVRTYVLYIFNLISEVCFDLLRIEAIASNALMRSPSALVVNDMGVAEQLKVCSTLWGSRCTLNRYFGCTDWFVTCTNWGGKCPPPGLLISGLSSILILRPSNGPAEQWHVNRLYFRKVSS